MCKMFMNFVQFLRSLFTTTKPEDILVDEVCPEDACKMQDNKVYYENEVPCTPEECVPTVGVDDVPEIVEEVAETAPAKKKHRGRPRKKKELK